jgi:hypothetical protein
MKGVCGWSGVIFRGAEVEKAQGDEDYYTRRNTGSSTSTCGAVQTGMLSKEKEGSNSKSSTLCSAPHTPLPLPLWTEPLSQMTLPLPVSASTRASGQPPLGQGRAQAEPGLVAWDLVPVETAACELVPVTPRLLGGGFGCSASRCGRGAKKGTLLLPLPPIANWAERLSHSRLVQTATGFPLSSASPWPLLRLS